MQKQVIISTGEPTLIKQGDKVELKDGRVLNVGDVNAPFGKIKMQDDQGGVAYVKPADIIRIIQEVVAAVEESKTLWKVLLGAIAFIKSLFKKNGSQNS